MTREEIEARIEELESDSFYLDMKDHWTSADFDRSRAMFNERMKLKKQLEEMEKENKNTNEK